MFIEQILYKEEDDVYSPLCTWLVSIAEKMFLFIFECSRYVSEDVVFQALRLKDAVTTDINLFLQRSL